MSSARGGIRGGGRGQSTFTPTQPSAARKPRPGFQSRGRATNDSVRFNGAATRGAASARGQQVLRGAARGRAPVPHASTPPPTINQASDGASFPARFQALKQSREKERALAIKQGFLADPDRPRTLAEAITPVGTCPDMCAEFERLERVVQKDVWGPETAPGSVDNTPAEQRMVKKFRRAAAGIDEQLPSDLRPPAVLKKTVEYLFDQVVGNAESLGSVHHFVWDRTRAVRNDFSIQQITKPADVEIAIECYERIARFHILSLHQLAVPEKPYDKYDWYQEREQLDRTLLSLMQYYDDSKGRLHCRNEAEFRAYCVIMVIQDPTPDLEERVNSWDDHVKVDPRVQVALELYAAASNTLDSQGPLKPRAQQPVAREDWNAFFSKVESNQTSYLMACTAEIYFNLIRKHTLNAIWRAFRRQGSTQDITDFTLELVTDWMGFDEEDQAENFCEHYGFVFKESNTGTAFLDLNAVQGRTFPEASQGLNQQTFSDGIVENKRGNRTLSAVIRGIGIAQAQKEGMVEELHEDSEMEGQETENEDSLFVPNGSSNSGQQAASPFGAPARAASPFSGLHSGNPGFGSPSVASPPPTANVPPKAIPFSFGAPSNTASPFQNPFAKTLEGSKWASPFAGQGNAAQQSKASNSISAASPFTTTSNHLGVSSGLGAAQTNGFPTMNPPVPAFSYAPPPEPKLQDDKLSSTSLFNTQQPGATTSMSDQKPTQAPFGSVFSPNSQQTQKVEQSAKLPAFSFSPIVPKKSPTGTSSEPSIAAPTDKSHFGIPSTGASSLFSNLQQPPASNGIQTPTFTFGSPKASGSGDSVGNGGGSSVEQQNAGGPRFSFVSPPSGPAASDPSVTPAATVSMAPQATRHSAMSRQPSFSFTQPNQPKNPSPLSQSFSAADKPGSGSPSVQQQIRPTRTPEPRRASQSALNNPSKAAPPQAAAPAKQETPRVNADEVFPRLAREAMLDLDKGFLKQFVEYHARSTIMSVYDELYMESIRRTADTFRRDTLATRYGKRWRDTCWRLRLARLGREKRQRARRGMEEREVKKTKMREVNAVDDFLAHSRVGLSASRLSDSQRTELGETHGRSFSPSLGSRAHSTTTIHQTADSTDAHQERSRAKINGTSHVDRAGRVTKPSPTPSESSSISARSHFLGFSLQAAKGNDRASPPGSRSSYFRMKAMGINPNGGEPVLNMKKRPREDSETDSSRGSPAAKRSRTPPRPTASQGPSRIRSESVQSQASRISFSPSVSTVTSTKLLPRPQYDDALLIARAKAARDALAHSTTSHRSEMEQSPIHSPPELNTSHASTSLQRARIEARLRLSQLSESASSQSLQPKVPAYRLRESRFVPREQYGRAIEIAKDNIEARSRPQSRLGEGGHDAFDSEFQPEVWIDPLPRPAVQNAVVSPPQHTTDFSQARKTPYQLVPASETRTITFSHPSMAFPRPEKNILPFDAAETQPSNSIASRPEADYESVIPAPAEDISNLPAHASVYETSQPFSQAASEVLDLLHDPDEDLDVHAASYSVLDDMVREQAEPMASGKGMEDSANPFRPLYDFGQGHTWGFPHTIDAELGINGVEVAEQEEQPAFQSQNMFAAIDPELLADQSDSSAAPESHHYDPEGVEVEDEDEATENLAGELAEAPSESEQGSEDYDEEDEIEDEQPVQQIPPGGAVRDGGEYEDEQDYDEEDEYSEEDEFDEEADDDDDEEPEEGYAEYGDQGEDPDQGQDPGGLIKGGTGASAEDAFELSD